MKLPGVINELMGWLEGMPGVINELSKKVDNHEKVLNGTADNHWLLIAINRCKDRISELEKQTERETDESSPMNDEMRYKMKAHDPYVSFDIPVRPKIMERLINAYGKSTIQDIINGSLEGAEKQITKPDYTFEKLRLADEIVGTLWSNDDPATCRLSEYTCRELHGMFCRDCPITKYKELLKED